MEEFYQIKFVIASIKFYWLMTNSSICYLLNFLFKILDFQSNSNILIYIIQNYHLAFYLIIFNKY